MVADMPSTILDVVRGPSQRYVHPFLDWPAPIAFAHRGGASDAPENTMEAFAGAVELGYRYVETDVHATADGVLVAFHDDDLQRTCGRPGTIGALPWAEVSAARVDGRAAIPLLEDLLGTWPELRVNIDCKTDAAVPALVSALRRTKALDRVCIASFSERRLGRLRAWLGDGACTSLGQRGIARLLAGTTRRSRAHAAQVPVRQGRITVTTPRFVTRAHAIGLHVHVWTVDDPAEMNRLLDIGVDGVMTDRPAVLREVLTARGQWL
jgi:glycerophosphoryl diester phosphodiesterase